MSELMLMRHVLQSFGRGACRLFRVNCGSAWQGRIVSHTNRYITLEYPRPFHGMPAGVSDLIGWQKVTVTPDMVGTEIAVFIAVETKSIKGRETARQRAFLRAVADAGGRGVAARSLSDVSDVLGVPGVPLPRYPKKRAPTAV